MHVPRPRKTGLALWEDCVSGVWALGQNSGLKVGFRKQMAPERQQAQGLPQAWWGEMRPPQDGPWYSYAWAP